MKRLPVVITMGDAAGIGPEIIAKTFADSAFMAANPAFVLGDPAWMQRQCAALGLPLQVQVVTSPDQVQVVPGVMHVMAPPDTPALPEDLPLGQISAQAGAMAFAAIRHAIELAMWGSVAGVCTAPIHKEALAAARVPYPGHTEMLADLSGCHDYAMMLVNPELRTILVTVHCAMSRAISMLSVERELRIIRLAHRAMRDYGIEKPRVAVAGLNPHAGEGGLFGREDQDIVAPAIRLAREEGIDASGPWPGDTVFMNARKGRFDIVVAQYHDQGLIPVKLAGVEDGVNITVGLPFIRTSPDHGTAFDIAGKGVADPASLRVALQTAHQFAQQKQRSK